MERRRVFNYQHGFDWAKATTEEQNAERERRDRYNAASQQRRQLFVPSIATASHPVSPSSQQPQMQN